MQTEGLASRSSTLRIYLTATCISESPAYLRHLGALDEQNPRKPAVIVPNVLCSKSNCMATSGFHTVRRADACEVPMAGLEQQVSEPAAAPALIAAVMLAMPSDTVAAPRNQG